MTAFSKAILFFNEKSGQADKEHQCEMIHVHLTRHEIDLEIVILPLPTYKIESAISKAIAQGCDLILAAGGDGTLSLVANAMIGTSLPLGILPIGTGNLLAQELGIPQNINKALDLITSDCSKTLQINTFTVKDRTYTLNLSIGVTPKVMNITHSEDKKRFGLIAYLVSFFKQILGLKITQFTIDCDGQKRNYQASEILITNSRTAGLDPLKWSQDMAINDGVLNIFIIRASNLGDLLRIAISFLMQNNRSHRGVTTAQFTNYCLIDSQKPLPVQADGDAIGKTPVEIRLNPQSLTVIVNSIIKDRHSKVKKEQT